MTLRAWFEADRTRTVAAFARQVRVSRQTVYNWIEGTVSPHAGKLADIEDATDGQVTVADVVAHAREVGGNL